MTFLLHSRSRFIHLKDPKQKVYSRFCYIRVLIYPGGMISVDHWHSSSSFCYLFPRIFLLVQFLRHFLSIFPRIHHAHIHFIPYQAKPLPPGRSFSILHPRLSESGSRGGTWIRNGGIIVSSPSSPKRAVLSVLSDTRKGSYGKL